VLLFAQTAYGDPGTRERAREAGFDQVLAKPCVIADLVGLLRVAGC
jgi:CheY-like chemotaxis protein